MTAGCSGVDCVEPGKHVDAVDVTGMAEEDKEATGRLRYRAGELGLNVKHKQYLGRISYMFVYMFVRGFLLGLGCGLGDASQLSSQCRIFSFCSVAVEGSSSAGATVCDDGYDDWQCYLLRFTCTGIVVAGRTTGGTSAPHQAASDVVNKILPKPLPLQCTSLYYIPTSPVAHHGNLPSPSAQASIRGLSLTLHLRPSLPLTVSLRSQ